MRRKENPTEQFLISAWEPIDAVGKGLMGELWRTVYLSIQDAIALSVLLKLPSLISHIIIGKNFSGFDACIQENAYGVSFYACFVIVISDFCLWVVLAGRILGRFFLDLRMLKRIQSNGSDTTSGD